MGLKNEKYQQKPYLGKRPEHEKPAKRFITEENYLEMEPRNTMDDPIPEENPDFKGLNPNRGPDQAEERKELPWLRDPNSSISCWELIKSCVSSGKDLFRMTMPVHFNEPFSILQKAAQQTEYNSLLDLACEEEDSMKRLAYIVAKQISNFTHCEKSNTKPFNPLLGETYELVTPKMQFFAE
jgi:oxysterol-binding protein 1